MTEDYLYHYTNTETLALILSNKTIRFNSLNNVDDLQEQETSDVKNFGQYCFVSCWTDDAEESIPMWKMYGNFTSGIRIKMKKYPFLERATVPYLSEDGLEENKTLITLKEMMDKKIVAAEDIVRQKDILFKVEYTTEQDKLYPKMLDYEASHIALDKLGRYKNKGWEFQKEWRYRLLLLPIDMTDFDKKYVSVVRTIYKMLCEVPSMLPFTYYDIQIADEAFSDMEIMLSPKISAGNRKIVETIVEKYNPKAKIVESSYAGLIA